MNNNIVIGKHTLESLTSGMYSDPYVVFREYIQNAADSIDDAYKAKLLTKGNDRINISVSPLERLIVIEDNGLGIPADKAEKTLVSIGNSQKTSDNSRGFRGIGRLSALSYCSKLTFETSFAGETTVSKIIIDATSAGGNYSIHESLRSQGILVKVENKAGKMHSKSMLIDDKHIIVGSMNFTKSGEYYNDENVMHIVNSEAIEIFRNQFYIMNH